MLQQPVSSSFSERLRDKIWIVSSGSLDSFPRPGCNCRLCQMARKGGKDRRLGATSIFYKDCLFDIGPGVWNRLRKHRVTPKAIILSHVHLDHLGDLILFPWISKRIPVWTSSLHKDLFQELKIKGNYFEPNSSFKPIPDLLIQTKIAIHTFTRPLSLLRFDDVIYAPDLGEITPLDLLFAKGVKFWMGDGFSFDEDFVLAGEKLHQSMKKLLVQLKKLKSLESVLFLGIGHHNRWPHEDLELIVKQFALAAQLPFTVEIGFDQQLIPM